jgi:hypothetical protein
MYLTFRPIGRRGRMWEDNIKLDVTQTGRDGVNRTDVAQDRDRWRALVIAVMNLRVP